jgi:hypothetical protein
VAGKTKDHHNIDLENHAVHNRMFHIALEPSKLEGQVLRAVLFVGSEGQKHAVRALLARLCSVYFSFVQCLARQNRNRRLQNWAPN